jgi:hypothetical protein
MNFSTLVSSVVVSLALSSAASAQWSSGGFNVGVGGSYGKYKVSETGPNGQTYNRTVTNNNLSWGVGLGGSSTNYPAYGGYGMGGYGMGGYGGGWGYGGYGYGAAALGAGLAVGAIAGAIAASNQPYYGYGYYDAPRVVQKKQIIIRNSPGARVIEQDIFDW